MIDKNEINMNSKEQKKPAIYADYLSFQGSTFESNIKSVNNLYLGQGIKISDVPFIIKEEKSNKYYLAVNQINIYTQMEQKTIYIPKKFLYIAFYFNNSIFYINRNNTLIIFKIESDRCLKFELEHKKKQKNETTKCKHLEGIDLKNIFSSLKQMNECNRIKDRYEILTKILNEYLKEKLDIENPKSFNNKITYEFKYNCLDYKCEVKSIEIEVDDIGVIREKIMLPKGEISLKTGISSLIKYVQLKKEGNSKKIKETNIINNTFNCPILYKNFYEGEIQENQTIITEIKSGFDLEGVEKQLVNRIDIVSKCLFEEGERPQYFIGLINLDSKDENKLQKYLEQNISFDKKSLIISIVDKEYFGLDLSCEIHNEYLIYKKLNGMEKKLNDTQTEVEKINKKLDDNQTEIEKINKKLDNTQNDVNYLSNNIAEILKLLNPKIGDIFIQKLKKKENEEKKET